MAYSYSSKLCTFFIIFAFALSSSFSPVAVEAKAKTKGFTLDVVHSSHIKLSPSYNQSAYGSSPNFKLESEAFPVGLGSYILKLYIGYPPREVHAIADTGSDVVWFQCTPCPECYQHNLPFYYPDTSSSYLHPDDCYAKECRALDGHCGEDNECMYHYDYADRSFSEGILSRENIYIPQSDGGLSWFPGFPFGCAFESNGTNFNRYHAGIVGLNLGELSLIRQLHFQKLSYCFPPASSNSSGKMAFGDDVITDGSVAGIVTTPLLTGPRYYENFYYVNLEGATVAGSKTMIPNNKGNTTYSSNILLDSGTTFTYLEQGFYNSLLAAVQEAISLTPAQNPYHNLCYKEFPEIEVVFHFRGADVTLKPYNLFVKLLHDDFVCFAMVPSSNAGTAGGDDAKNHIWGNVAQANFQVTYDLANKLVSFAPADCGAQV